MIAIIWLWQFTLTNAVYFTKYQPKSSINHLLPIDQTDFLNCATEKKTHALLRKHLKEIGQFTFSCFQTLGYI